MLEDHAKDFVKKWMARFGIYDEQDGVSIHIEFNKLKITCCRMYPSSIRFENMLQDHFRRIHPESKAVKCKNKFRRKRKHPYGIPTWLVIKQLASCS